MELAIPAFGTLRLEHLVLDYNGTLALDGRPLPGVKTRLKRPLGIVVLQAQCASMQAVAAADMLAPSVTDALDVFLQPRRLLASLRSSTAAFRPKISDI